MKNAAVGQVQAMVVTEAAIMGAIAGVLAVVTGLVVAATLINGGASAELAAGMRLPWGLLIAVVLVGLAGGLTLLRGNRSAAPAPAYTRL